MLAAIFTIVIAVTFATAGEGATERASGTGVIESITAAAAVAASAVTGIAITDISLTILSFISRSMDLPDLVTTRLEDQNMWGGSQIASRCFSGATRSHGC